MEEEAEMGESGIPRRAIADGAISPKKLESAVVDGSYFYEACNYQPLITDTTGAALSAGTDDTEFLVHFKSGPVLGHYIGGATILGPQFNATAGVLDLALDKANTEGVEYDFDSADAGGVGPFAYTVGTSGALQLKADVTLEDVSELGECAFGFRKVAAAGAVIDDYTDIAVINVQAGTINVETILNDGTTSTTDTGLTWADGATKEVKVILGIADNGAANGAGVARFFIDGVEVGAPFTFDSGDVLIPFIHIIQAVAVAGSYVGVSELEVSQLVDVDDHFVH